MGYVGLLVGSFVGSLWSRVRYVAIKGDFRCIVFGEEGRSGLAFFVFWEGFWDGDFLFLNGREVWYGGFFREW